MKTLALLPALISLVLLFACARTDTQDAGATAAPTTDPCYNKGSNVTNATQQLCFGIICAHLALSGVSCHPDTPPNPPPVPSAMGGSSATGGASSAGGNAATGGMVATGGASSVAVQFPACSNTMKAPSASQIDQYRKTLKKRHKGHERTQRAPVAPVDAALANVFWTSNLAESLDQTNIGRCTGNAAAGCVSTKPFGLQLNEDNATSIYSLATKLDDAIIPGRYPPDDTGSTGAFACQALIQLGYAKSCASFVGYPDAIARVQSQPIIVGMNWLNDMFTPNNCGGLSVSGPIEGGHEVEIVGYDAGNKRVWLQNSWSNSWGVCLGTHCGYFYLGVNDLAGSKLDAEFDAPNLN